MAAFNNDGTNENDDMVEAKSEETEQLSAGNTDDTLVKRFKLKASSIEKGKRYNCEECGRKMMNRSSLNTHIRSIHEGIKYPCGQCQYQATSKGNLAEHINVVHQGIKYPCGLCQHQASSKENLVKHKKAVHQRIIEI